MGFTIRKPFHRTNTSDAFSLEGSNPSTNDNAETSEKLPAVGTSTQAMEVKASGADIEGELAGFRELHQWDPNLPEAVQHQVDNALKSHDIEREIALDHELNQENSIYPEGTFYTLCSKPHPVEDICSRSHTSV